MVNAACSKPPVPCDSVLITDLRFLLVDQLFNPSTLRVPYAHQVPVFTLSELVYGIEDRLSSGVVLEFRERLQMLQECLFASIALLTSFVSPLCRLADNFRGLLHGRRYPEQVLGERDPVNGEHWR